MLDTNINLSYCKRYMLDKTINLSYCKRYMLDNKAIHCPWAVSGPVLFPSKFAFDPFLALFFLALFFLFFVFAFKFPPENLD